MSKRQTDKYEYKGTPLQGAIAGTDFVAKLAVDHICECGHRSSEHAEPQPNLSNPCRTGKCLCNGFNFARVNPVQTKEKA